METAPGEWMAAWIADGDGTWGWMAAWIADGDGTWGVAGWMDSVFALRTVWWK